MARHPLVRSAVCEAAGLARRQAMHRALAEVLAGVPNRQVWHRAAPSLGQDEEVAAGLEAAADRAFRRGAIAEQAAALAQAARLSPRSSSAGPPSLRAGTLSLRIVTPSLRAVSRARWLFEADVAQAYTGDEALVAGRHHSGHLVIEGRVGAAVAGQAEVDRSQLIDPQAAEVAFGGLLP